jgi:acetoin utilization deacetylase AcuC-like enzyme
MIVVHSEAHRRRDAATELHGGRLVRPFERPERVDRVLAALAGAGFPEPRSPDAHGLDPVLAVHDAAYVAFLSTVWDDWRAQGFEGEAIPTVWPSRRMWRDRVPSDVEGKLGWYALAGETSIAGGTWEAARASADVALTGAAHLAAGAPSAFALCRPPGHHAAQDMFGGYCFLNNAALAAQALREAGAGRVAVLDVDFHHGNGTQAIFYERSDVVFASIHGDPDEAFPHFLGGADETGAGAGEGANHNFPLPRGTGWEAWSAALDEALARVGGAEALVVSLGVDTFRGDPIGFFALESEDFPRMGERIARLGRPALFVMEGGYAVAEIGLNTVGVLQGFEDGAAK